MLISFETRNKLYGILISARRKFIKREAEQGHTHWRSSTKHTRNTRRKYVVPLKENSCFAFFSHYCNSFFCECVLKVCVDPDLGTKD